MMIPSAFADHPFDFPLETPLYKLIIIIDDYDVDFSCVNLYPDTTSERRKAVAFSDRPNEYFDVPYKRTFTAGEYRVTCVVAFEHGPPGLFKGTDTRTLIITDSNTPNVGGGSDDTPSDNEPKTTKKKKGGSTYNPPPTLGVDKDGKRLVEKGFSFNGHATDAARYWTPYPLITTNVNEKNTVELIVYEDRGINNLKWVQLFLGLEEVGQPTSEAEAAIHLILSNTEFEEVIITDKHDLIQDIIIHQPIPHKCKQDSNTELCLKLKFEYEYRGPLFYHVYGVSLMDTQKNSWNHYFNEGVMVIGESLNEPPTDRVFTKKGAQYPAEWLDMTRIDKINDIWADQNGIKYHKVNNHYDRITPMPATECITPDVLPMNGGTRADCWWRAQLPHLW